MPLANWQSYTPPPFPLLFKGAEMLGCVLRKEPKPAAGPRAAGFRTVFDTTQNKTRKCLPRPG